MSRHFDAPMETFVEALSAALPNTERADLYWCYHISSSRAEGGKNCCGTSRNSASDPTKISRVRVITVLR